MFLRQKKSLLDHIIEPKTREFSECRCAPKQEPIWQYSMSLPAAIEISRIRQLMTTQDTDVHITYLHNTTVLSTRLEI